MDGIVATVPNMQKKKEREEMKAENGSSLKFEFAPFAMRTL